MTTLSFKGALRERLRITLPHWLGGHDLFVGPWTTKPVEFTAPIPDQGTSLHLPAGLILHAGLDSSGVGVELDWEGISLYRQSVPLHATIPVSLQPIHGVILTGVLSVASSDPLPVAVPVEVAAVDPATHYASPAIPEFKDALQPSATESQAA